MIKAGDEIFFEVGDKVKTQPAKYFTDYANSVYANRNATVIGTNNHCGLYETYKIEFDEPFYDHGYKVKTMYYAAFQDGLVLR